MPKKIDDVIIPIKKRSIRNIPIPEGRRKVVKPAMDMVEPAERPTRVSEIQADYSAIPPQRPPLPPRHRSRAKGLWLTFFAFLLILTFGLLSFFSGATLAYTPKSALLAFNNEVYSAAKTGEGELLYSVVKLSGDKGKAVSASGEREVTKKASGTIVVYNNNPSEQKLIENTRFESTSGKIYRISQSITLPAKRGDAPGTLEVTVTADQGGEAYNSAPTDFTVPGLKGTPRYTTIYGRSKGAFTGGFAGKEKVVSPPDELQAKGELRASLSNELMQKAQAEVPPDFILSPSLSSVTFEDLPQSPTGEAATANVNLRGHLYGIMFKRSDLAKALSKTKTAVSANEIVDMESFDTLKLTFSGTPPTELLPLNKINFKVEGSGRLLWRTDEVALKADLLGRKKNELSSILNNFPTIADANVTIRPFWKTSFPESAEKISIQRGKAE